MRDGPTEGENDKSSRTMPLAPGGLSLHRRIIDELKRKERSGGGQENERIQKENLFNKMRDWSSG